MTDNNYLRNLLGVSESEIRELMNGKPISDEDYLNSLTVDERKKVEFKRRQLLADAKSDGKELGEALGEVLEKRPLVVIDDPVNPNPPSREKLDEVYKQVVDVIGKP